MEKDWVRVYSSQYLHKVEIMKAKLEENEIECVIMNKQDSAFLLGVIELYVEAINAVKADQIINKNSKF